MRITIIGSSGSGKSTLARRLGEALALPAIELDAINWQAGWRDLNTHDPETFIARVDQAIAADGWVSDGNYARVQRHILARATHLVWLDYDRALTMNRVIRRSIARSWTGRELWPGTGNRENWRHWLDKEHPIRWAWDTFAVRRERYEALCADPRLAHLTIHRLRHPRDADALVAEWAGAQG
jgi:adenylate kinase family enzyme